MIQKNINRNGMMYMQHDPHCSQFKNSVDYENISTMQDFINTYTITDIENKLNERIIGQKELVKEVSMFLYYHALRQIYPELPPRPMLISGPSGSGKTEVFRVISKIFKDYFKIKIIDGASITKDGWKGDNKLNSHIDSNVACGGILIVDEFDKLAKPNFESNGTNVSAAIQAEFLKLLEGELEVKKTVTDAFGFQQKKIIKTEKLGIVLVGAFETIREKKENKKHATIGFGINKINNTSKTNQMIDEDYIEFGVLPELIGRVATKCTTNELTNKEYITIIRNPYSRVSIIRTILQQHKINTDDCIQDSKLETLIETSKLNKTGVRWVSSQVENILLEKLRDAEIKIKDPTFKDLIEMVKIDYAKEEKEDELFF